MPHTDNRGGANWRPTVVADTIIYKSRFRQPLRLLVAHAWFNYLTYRMDVVRMSDHHGVVSTKWQESSWICI